MEKLLVKGEKFMLCRINDALQSFIFELTHAHDPNGHFDVDIFAFMLEENNRVHKDNIIFYNNPSSINGAIQYHELYEQPRNKKKFEMILSQVPSNMENLCFACSIYKKREASIKESGSTSIEFRVFNKTMGNQLFAIKEKLRAPEGEVYILGDVYRYKDTWRFSAVRQEMKDELLEAVKKLYNVVIY